MTQLWKYYENGKFISAVRYWKSDWIWLLFSSGEGVGGVVVGCSCSCCCCCSPFSGKSISLLGVLVVVIVVAAVSSSSSVPSKTVARGALRFLRLSLRPARCALNASSESLPESRTDGSGDCDLPEFDGPA